MESFQLFVKFLSRSSNFDERIKLLMRSGRFLDLHAQIDVRVFLVFDGDGGLHSGFDHGRTLSKIFNNLCYTIEMEF